MIIRYKGTKWDREGACFVDLVFVALLNSHVVSRLKCDHIVKVFMPRVVCRALQRQHGYHITPGGLGKSDDLYAETHRLGGSKYVLFKLACEDFEHCCEKVMHRRGGQHCENIRPQPGSHELHQKFISLSCRCALGTLSSVFDPTENWVQAVLALRASPCVLVLSC